MAAALGSIDLKDHPDAIGLALGPPAPRPLYRVYGDGRRPSTLCVIDSTGERLDELVKVRRTKVKYGGSSHEVLVFQACGRWFDSAGMLAEEPASVEGEDE